MPEGICLYLNYFQVYAKSIVYGPTKPPRRRNISCNFDSGSSATVIEPVTIGRLGGVPLLGRIKDWPVGEVVGSSEAALGTAEVRSGELAWREAHRRCLRRKHLPLYFWLGISNEAAEFLCNCSEGVIYTVIAIYIYCPSPTVRRMDSSSEAMGQEHDCMRI